MIRTVCQNRLGVFSNPNCWYTGPVWEIIGWVGVLAVWVWNDMFFDLGAPVHWGWILWGLRCGGCVVVVVVVV